MLDFLLAIPTMNEKKYVAEILEETEAMLKRKFNNYKIVIVDASSEESEITLLKNLTKNNKNVELITGRNPSNKGSDVRYAFSRYDSKLYCFIDADLSPSIEYLKQMFGYFPYKCDLVIGSRYADKAVVQRPKLLLFASLSYNKLINIFFGDKVKDHQCGLKMFNRKALKIIKKFSQENHFAWDTEIILICTYKGLKLCEMPIYWVERRRQKTSIKKLVSDTLVFIPAMIRMFYRFKVKGIT
jgi:glycosyltransferase involved in cell wall biosynthesis